jgi:hypothetical protein
VATLSQVISTVTQAGVFQTIMRGHVGNGVPTASWTSLRNVGLSLTQVTSQLLATLQNAVAASISGLFLDYAGARPGMDAVTAAAADAALTLFAKSQFQLDRVQPQATVGLHLLTGSKYGPTINLAVGDAVDGTPGTLAAGAVLYANSEAGTLAPGTLAVPGGGEGFTLTQLAAGVSVRFTYSGANQSLAAGIAGSSITYSLATDADGNPSTTAGDFAAWIAGGAGGGGTLVSAAALGAGKLVLGKISLPGDAPLPLDGGALLLGFTAQVAGASGNVSPGSPIVVKAGNLPGVSVSLPPWMAGTWITSQGADLETAAALKARCVARWGTLGVAGTEQAARFWATAIPTGYKSSPVSAVQVLANYDTALPGFRSNFATVVVVGSAGALTGAQLAAVRANFTSPVTSASTAGVPGLSELGSKVPLGCGLRVVSASNVTVTLTGTVNVYASSGTSIADVQSAVAQAVAAYQRTLAVGMTLYPQKKVAGVIGQASPYAAAIADVDLSGMANTIVMGRLEYPVLDLSGLTYNTLA